MYCFATDGLLSDGDIGREKFVRLLFAVSAPSLASFSSGASNTLESLLASRDVRGGGMLALSTLTPLAPFPLGVGDVTRCTGGGSTLADRLCCGDTFFGRAGTGGTSGGGDLAPETLSEGDGDLNVRSVIDPALFCLDSPPLPTPPRAPLPMTLPLPTDDCDPRRAIRFVTRLPTGSGEVVWDRKAAAAAAEEREAFDDDFGRNEAAAAAVAAFIVAASGGGYMVTSVCDATSYLATDWTHTLCADDPRRRENMLGILSSCRRVAAPRRNKDTDRGRVVVEVSRENAPGQGIGFRW